MHVWVNGSFAGPLADWSSNNFSPSTSNRNNDWSSESQLVLMCWASVMQQISTSALDFSADPTGPVQPGQSHPVQVTIPGHKSNQGDGPTTTQRRWKADCPVQNPGRSPVSWNITHQQHWGYGRGERKASSSPYTCIIKGQYPHHPTTAYLGSRPHV